MQNEAAGAFIDGADLSSASGVRSSDASVRQILAYRVEQSNTDINPDMIHRAHLPGF